MMYDCERNKEQRTNPPNNIKIPDSDRRGPASALPSSAAHNTDMIKRTIKRILMNNQVLLRGSKQPELGSTKHIILCSLFGSVGAQVTEA